uniref:SH3 domain-containing protein n=1 Tax=Strigamia maritima TaxID=126957 RepID=T1JKL8_STRMM
MPLQTQQRTLVANLTIIMTKDMKNGSRDRRDQRTSSRAIDSKDGHEKIPRREGSGRGRDERGRDGRMQRSGRDYGPPHEMRGGRGPPRGEPRSSRMPHDDRSSGHIDVRRREDVNRQPYRRYDSHGQVVIEPEENLSDKEIYPQQGTTMAHMSIPSIEITKDSASEGRNSIDNFSDEEYVMSRNGGRGGRRHPGYHEPRGRHPSDYGEPRSSRDHAAYEDREWGGRKQENYGQNEYSRRRGPHNETIRPRYFRALFDYDPQTMSPNPNAMDEELMFQEGQIIKVIF